MKAVSAASAWTEGDRVPAYEGIPKFPREIQITGQGGLLALNGERKIGIKTRGAPWLRITLARVPVSQVQHLARFTEGDFQSPYFKGWIDETNIGHFHREVVKIPMPNEYEAVFTSFDFSEAVKRADLSDPDGSRGMFFLNIEGVQPVKQSKRAKEGDATLEDWQVIHNGDELLTEEQLNEELNDDELEAQKTRHRRHVNDDDSQDEGSVFAKRFILVTDLGPAGEAQRQWGAGRLCAERAEGCAGGQRRSIIVLAKNGEFVAQKTTTAGRPGHAAERRAPAAGKEAGGDPGARRQRRLVHPL